MMLANTPERYGFINLWLHWLMALAILVIYGLGLWIDELDYYDALYQTLPRVHEGIGVLVGALLVFRLGWRLFNVTPDDSDLRPFERRAAHLVHWGFYLLIALAIVSGYLISTADGRALDVFGWFRLPATVHGPHQEDIAGDIHEWLANAILIIAAVHAVAALKHHYIDGGASLRRMLPTPRNPR